MKHDLFRSLYDHCQTLTPKIKRNAIIGKLLELTGGPRIRVVISPLDTNVTRGFFLHATNVEHPFVRANGMHVVVLAKGLNECWERFVHVKEAMHLLDDDGELTDSEEKFVALLNDLTSPAVGEASPQYQADMFAIYMALTCFCPEASRLRYEQLVRDNQIDNYGVALQLKIPELYVPLLFKPNFRQIVSMLRAE